MTIGFSSRAAVSACALCAVVSLTAGPSAFASAGPGTPDPRRTSSPDRPRTPGAPSPALLRQPGTHVHPRPGAPALPGVSALSWVVADADSGAVLAASDAHRSLPPASTLKTLFALTVLPVLPAGIRHRVSPRELEGIGAGSSMVGVAEGRTYTVADLWRGVFLNSGNDAVHVLAALNGGWETTARRMQAKARSLGALDTHVLSPDGYDTPGQVSSAYDLAVFGRAGLRNADFARYCGLARARFPGGGGWSYEIENTNRLLTGEDGIARYPGLVGVKNGYTSNAGNTLVAAARKGGRTLVVTVMNPQAGGGFAVYEEARELLDWGFAAVGRVDAVGSLDALRTRPRPGPGVDAAVAAAVPAGDGGPGWSEAAMIAGAAALGAGGVSLVLRAGRRR